MDLKLRTKTYALSILTLCGRGAKPIAGQILAKQLIRSGTSVGANYREASRSRSNAEFTAKIGDCLKELEESTYWLELLMEGGFSPATAVHPLLQETRELTAIFTAIDKKVKSRP